MVPKVIEGNYVVYFDETFEFYYDSPHVLISCVPGGFFVLHRLEGRQ